MAVFSFKNKTYSRSMLNGNEAYDPGAMVAIASVTTTAGQASVSFTSIPSTYAALQIWVMGRSNEASTNATDLKIQFNSDTATNYAYHILQGNGSAASAAGGATQSTMYAFRALPGNSSTSGIFGAAVVDVHDYASTSKYKTLRVFSGSDRNAADTTYRVQLSSGLWMSTSAVSSVQLSCDVNFAAGSTFHLFGIKG